MPSASSRDTRTGSFALVALSLVLHCGCGGKPHHETTEVYYMVTASHQISYWREAAEGVNAAARDLGVRVEVLGPDTHDAAAEKEALLTALHRTPPPSGILVSAADPDLMRDAIDSAVSAGIPVITIDADSPKSKRQFFIGTNNYEVGQMGGDLVVKELNGKGTVAVYSNLGQANLDSRLQGYRRAFEQQPGIKITQVIDIGGDSAKAFDATREMIEKKIVPDAFVCVESMGCEEIAEALSRAKIHGKTIVAMDTSEGTLDWIRKGMIRATIAQKPYTMAYYGLRALDDLHHMRNVTVDGSRSTVPVFMCTGTTVVDKSNVTSFQGAGGG